MKIIFIAATRIVSANFQPYDDQPVGLFAIKPRESAVNVGYQWVSADPRFDQLFVAASMKIIPVVEHCMPLVSAKAGPRKALMNNRRVQLPRTATRQRYRFDRGAGLIDVKREKYRPGDAFPHQHQRQVEDFLVVRCAPTARRVTDTVWQVRGAPRP